MKFHCPKCGKQLKVGDEFAGRKAQCPACQTALVIPQEMIATDSSSAQPVIPAKSPSSAGLDSLPKQPTERDGKLKIKCSQCGFIFDRHNARCPVCKPAFTIPQDLLSVANPTGGDDAQDTKTCPYCGENIRAVAKVCRYCGMDLLKGVNTRTAIGEPMPTHSNTHSKSVTPSATDEWCFVSPDSVSNSKSVTPFSTPYALVIVVIGVVVFFLAGTVRVYHGGDIGLRVVMKDSFSFKDTIVNLDDVLGKPRFVVAAEHPAVKRQLEDMRITESDDAARDRIKKQVTEDAEDMMKRLQSSSRGY